GGVRDGREVLFNRDYRSVLERRGGRVTAAQGFLEAILACSFLPRSADTPDASSPAAVISRYFNAVTLPSSANSLSFLRNSSRNAARPVASSNSKCSRKVGREMPKIPEMTSSEVPQDTKITTSSRCLFVGLNRGPPPFSLGSSSIVKKPSQIQAPPMASIRGRELFIEDPFHAPITEN